MCFLVIIKFPLQHKRTSCNQTLLLLPIGGVVKSANGWCPNTNFGLSWAFSDQVLKETFQKICISLGFERKCRNMHRRRGTGIHKSISSLKLLPLLIHRKISQKLREREREWERWTRNWPCPEIQFCASTIEIMQSLWTGYNLTLSCKSLYHYFPETLPECSIMDFAVHKISATGILQICGH